MATMSHARAPPANPEALPVELARALGDPLRWRIVELLATEQLCVAHLAEELQTAQPLVSHHLKVLREAGLIEPDRYRYWTYYRLRPGALVHLAATLGCWPAPLRAGRPAAGWSLAPSRPARPLPARRPQGGPPMPTAPALDPTSRHTFARSIESLPEEFRGIYSLETIERFVDESIDRLSGARVVDFIPLFVHRFARERLRALAQAQGAIVNDVPEVLFVCVHNAGRSQMAAALLDHHAKGTVHVRSAGSAPGDKINPAVAAAMDEWGSTCPGSSPSRSPTSSSRPPTRSSPWAVGMPARSIPGKRYEDGSSRTRPASRSRSSAASATTSTPASSSCSPSWSQPAPDSRPRRDEGRDAAAGDRRQRRRDRAALRARELDPSVEATVVVADAFPNFSICGLPYYLSGDVPDWRDLAHRTTTDLEQAGLRATAGPHRPGHRPSRQAGHRHQRARRAAAGL